MKMNKNELDEMQKEKRNSIGNQMFLITFYALFLDCGLYGWGIHWLSYPANIMVIIMIAMSIYLVRTIAANAYLPPKTQGRRSVILILCSIIVSFSVAAVISKLLGKFSVTSVAANANDNSGMILFIVSSVGLLISLIVMIIKNVNQKDMSDD